MNPLMVTRTHTFWNAYQRGANLVAVLRFIPNAKNPNSATEVLKFSLAAFVECRLDRGAMTRAELSAPHQLIEGPLDQLLQIAGSQVEKDLAVVKSLLQALPRSSTEGLRSRSRWEASNASSASRPPGKSNP